MPTYTYRCPDCGIEAEHFMRISEFEQFEPPECCEPMRLVIQPVSGHVQMEVRYKSIVTGNEITSWKDRREEFARENLVDVSDMPTDWRDDIGKPPKWARPITNDQGEVDPMVGTFGKRGTETLTDKDLRL